MLLRLQKRLSDKQDGFTLIELVIVIVVLGILAAIVLFGVGTFRQDATSACTTANAKQLATAQAAYQAQYGGSAPSADALVTAGYLQTAPGSCG